MDSELLLQEMRALSAASQVLPLLYCQAWRDVDAKKHLLAEGFRWCLSVLNCSSTGHATSSSCEEVLVDGRSRSSVRRSVSSKSAAASTACLCGFVVFLVTKLLPRPCRQ